MNKNTDHAAEDAERFPFLLGGEESQESTKARVKLYRKVWTALGEKIGRIVNHVDETALTNIVQFVKKPAPFEKSGRIPTGLVLTGPNHSTQGRLLGHWSDQTSQSLEEIIVLDSNQAQNVTAALKCIIRTAIVQRNGLNFYHLFLAQRKKTISMNYDLELLEIFLKEEGLEKIVISIPNVEVFDFTVLSDLISTLSSWVDRLPFVFLFGITTTLDLFEARLPRSVIRLLAATTFDVSSLDDNFYRIFQTVQDSNDIALWLGPSICSLLLERSKDQDETIEAFARSIRYVFMCHFFANPLSILVEKPELAQVGSLGLICDSIRNSDSFRDYVESLLEANEYKSVKKLLEDDHHLLKTATQAISNGQSQMRAFRRSATDFIRLWNALPLSDEMSISAFELDIQIFSGASFLEGDIYTKSLSSIQKLTSIELENLVNICPMTPDQGNGELCAKILTTLRLLNKKNNGTAILSAYHPKNSTTSITSSNANAISLKKQTPRLSSIEKEYTSIVDRVLDYYQRYFERTISDSKKLFMHEVFIYDLKQPLTGSFVPRPRYAIERALDRPADYLGCECCSSVGRGDIPVNGQLPQTSLLWRLWCEAGNVVNVRDLWEAFRARVVEDEDIDGEVEEPGELGGIGANKTNERVALALFYRGLAEIKMLGFVKPTKRKVDCVAKTAWRGL